MCSNDRNEILLMSRLLHCLDMCKISLWSVKYILNQSTAYFGWISNSIKILVGPVMDSWTHWGKTQWSSFCRWHFQINFFVNKDYCNLIQIAQKFKITFLFPWILVLLCWNIISSFQQCLCTASRPTTTTATIGASVAEQLHISSGEDGHIGGNFGNGNTAVATDVCSCDIQWCLQCLGQCK